MTREEKEQSLINARQAVHFLMFYIVESQDVDGRIKQDIACLLTEFKRLDEKEQAQIKAGKRYGKLGAEHGRKGGRPKKPTTEEK